MFPQISNKISGNALCPFLQKVSFVGANKRQRKREKEEVNKGMSARERAVSTEQNRRRRGGRESGGTRGNCLSLEKVKGFHQQTD